MKKEIRQILENQLIIMSKLNLLFTNEAVNTQEILNPTITELSACDMEDLDKIDSEEGALVSKTEKIKK